MTVDKHTPALTFRSKVDGWFIAASMAAYGICGLAILSMTTNGISVGGSLALAFVAFWSWLLFGTSYAIDDRALTVRVGPVHRRIDLAVITTVRESRSLMAAAGLSTDRIEIASAGGALVYISPADKAGFVQALKARVPGLVVESLINERA